MADIDEIIENVKREFPTCDVQQLKVTHPADDDGIWYFSLPGLEPEIQIESGSGNCPFLVETDEQSSLNARRSNTVDEAVSMIVDYLSGLTQSKTD